MDLPAHWQAYKYKATHETTLIFHKRRSSKSRMTLVSSLQTLYNQIMTCNLPDQFPKPKSAFLARAERNHVFRWSLTALLVIAYMLRVFDKRGYFLLTLGLSLYLASYLLGYFKSELDVCEASDNHFMPVDKYEIQPVLVIYFSKELSTPELDALVGNILEFKFWYTITKGILIALLLTWFTLIRIPSVGPVEIFWMYCVLVVIRNLMLVAEKLKSKQA